MVAVLIKYTKGYKYQLREDCFTETEVKPDVPAITDLVQLYPSGLLVIKKYFAWDGCSGPTVDTRTNMRAGLVHDGFFYLMREGLLSKEWIRVVNWTLRQIMLEDGAFKWRADLYYRALIIAADKHADPCNVKRIYLAP